MPDWVEKKDAVPLFVYGGIRTQHDKYVSVEAGSSALSCGPLGPQTLWSVYEGPYGAYLIKDYKGRYLSVEAAGGKVHHSLNIHTLVIRLLTITSSIYRV
jgi:hypothetical protein